MSRMKLGLLYSNTMGAVQPDVATALAEHAEAAGVDTLWTVEHVVVPGNYESTYPYNRSGKMPGGEDGAFPDPVVWLAFVAARTSRIRLGTAMMILPQRNPVITAKALATLDVLSGGRMVLGAGIGWLKEEFDAIGIPFAERGSRTDESIEAMRALWRDDHPSFHGRHYNFDDARMWPKPVNRAIPVIVGGHSEPAARRAGRLGDGFFPAAREPEVNAAMIELMRQTATDAGRDPSAIRVILGGWPDAEKIEWAASCGADQLAVPVLAPDIDTARDSIDSAMAALRANGGEA
ncbi:MAG: hypothetical protein QOE92_1826 [Chloroflexota bacterium]|jgi:probable F420-dependent oxidoreductase|nr:hypothetical protein [Chloroflexota bacterium]